MKRILIILLFLTQITIFSQSYVSLQDSILILEQLNIKFNIEYEINDIINVDSLEVHYDENRYIIENEYGTLDNCIIFTACKKDQLRNCNAVVGVFKNGNIKWCSEYLIPSEDIYGDGFIEGVWDLNNNGKVEIITIWSSRGGASYGMKTLFLHSWDGNLGQISVDMSDGESPIGIYENGVFHYVDVEGDGVWEVVSDSYGVRPYVAAWNGINYSLEGAPELETMERFFPRNNFTAKVKTTVKRSEKKYSYSYEVYNTEESKQAINKFVVFGFDEYVKLYGSNYNEPDDLKTYAKNWIGGILSTCIYWKGEPIDPGKNLKGFTYLVEGLPIIGKSYLRGANYCSYPGDYRENTSAKDFLTNSVIVKALASRLPLSPFIPMNFIDTIKTYCDSSYSLGWIKEEPTLTKYNNYLTTAKNYLTEGDSSAARNELQFVLNDCVADSSTVLTSEAFALLYFNTEYLISQLPEGETYPYLKVKLKDSQGNLIEDGSLKYYESGWKDAVNNGDGTFNVETDKEKVSLKMYYAGASQQKNNITVAENTVTFQTVETTVKLLNSQNELLDGGSVKYYANGWKDFGEATNGEVTKELLPREYSFRMSYGGAKLDKQQDLQENTTVTFQTVETTVKLLNSQNELLDGGSVKYYANGWKDFGEATNGEVTKELLPREYSFRMSYAGAKLDKQQDLQENTTVVFQTVETTVKLLNSQNELLDGGTVKYYANGWKDFGEATNGEVTKELLPREYSFRMSYAGANLDKKQDLQENTTVVFQTVETIVKLLNSQNELLDGGSVKYYANGWKDFGEATNGEVTKELLPKEYSFRMSYGGANLDKQQDLQENTTVVFQTVNALIKVSDVNGQEITGALVSYYANSWNEIGNTNNGEISKELLPKNYSFRVNNSGVNQDKQQDISDNNIVEFIFE